MWRNHTSTTEALYRVHRGSPSSLKTMESQKPPSSSHLTRQVRIKATSQTWSTASTIRLKDARITSDTTTHLLLTTRDERIPGRHTRSTGASGTTNPNGRIGAHGVRVAKTGTNRTETPGLVNLITTGNTGQDIMIIAIKRGLTLVLDLVHHFKRNEMQRNSTSSMINIHTTDLTNSTATKDLSFDKNDYWITTAKL